MTPVHSHPNDRIVIRHPKGWAVQAVGAERPGEVLATQNAAIARAKRIVANRGGGQMRIQGADGRFRRAIAVRAG